MLRGLLRDVRDVENQFMTIVISPRHAREMRDMIL